jgi:hypothetical protein
VALSLCAWLCIVIVVGAPAAICSVGILRLVVLGVNQFENKHDAGRSGMHQKPWRPAVPRIIRRKCQLRKRRNLGRETRCLARFRRRIHADYGAAAAWLCRPAVYPWVCRALFVVRLMGWCRLVVFVVTTTRHHRDPLGAALFYVCCVFGLPLLPDAINVLQAGVFISLRCFRMHKGQEPRASKPMGASHRTTKVGLHALRENLVRALTLDQRRLVEERRWLELQQPGRRKRRERSWRRQQARLARANQWLRCALYASCAASHAPISSESSGVVVVEEPVIPNIVAHVQGAEPLHASISSDSSGLVVVLEPVISDIGAHVQGSEPLHDTAADFACDPEPCSW